MSIKKIVALIFVLVIMFYVDYRMFFKDYSQKSIVTTSAYLSEKPKFRRSKVFFHTNKGTFELRNRYVVGITLREILQLTLKDKITFYFYKNADIIDFLNNRTRILGIETKQFKKFRYKKVRDLIRSEDVNSFWIINFISAIVLLAMFSKKFYRFIWIEDSSM
jgi:hypothetical protein